MILCAVSEWRQAEHDVRLKETASGAEETHGPVGQSVYVALADRRTDQAIERIGRTKVNSSTVFNLVEIPFIIAAVLLGVRAARQHRAGPVRRGLGFLVAGLVVMAIGHAHMQLQHHLSLDLFEVALGADGARIAWLAALAASWTMTAYGFRQMTLSSMVDALTGIGNRRNFDSALELTIRRASRTGTGTGLVLLDIDHFKAFNDHYGHQEGDRCLRTVAQTLERTANRATDIVCRYGGEEFAVVVTHTEPDGPARLAEVLRGTIEELSLEHAGTPSGTLTISAGAAFCEPSSGLKPDALIQAADGSLYQAKEAGRNEVRSTTVENDTSLTGGTTTL